jgi:hypothetical protein
MEVIDSWEKNFVAGPLYSTGGGRGNFCSLISRSVRQEILEEVEDQTTAEWQENAMKNFETIYNPKVDQLDPTKRFEMEV